MGEVLQLGAEVPEYLNTSKLLRAPTKEEIMTEMLAITQTGGPVTPSNKSQSSSASIDLVQLADQMNLSTANPEALARFLSQMTEGTGEQREVLLEKKNQGDRFGLTITKVGHCVFAISIRAGFLADVGGIRFGDQILSINGHAVDLLGVKEVTDIFNEADSAQLLIRTQPHVITCTIRPSLNATNMGVTLVHGAVVKISRKSALYAAGVLPGYVVISVSNRNAVGLRSKAILEMIKKHAGSFFTVQVMPLTTFTQMTSTVDVQLVAQEMY